MADDRNVIAAFSEEHAERLTGITKSQLRYWDRIGFYVPAYAEGNRRIPFSRIYSFQDIVALRVLDSLRNVNNVPLGHLRKVSERLSQYGIDRWTGVQLWALNRKVIWQGPNDEKPQEVISGQYVMPVVLKAIIADTERLVAAMNTRDEKLHGMIEKSRFVSHNAAVLAGTRIPVNAIKRFAEAGYNVAEILKEYPDLTTKDVEAAIAYVSRAAA